MVVPYGICAQVKEQGGFVWLFYGDADLPVDERPRIPDIPELHDPNWRAVYGEIEFKAGENMHSPVCWGMRPMLLLSCAAC